MGLRADTGIDGNQFSQLALVFYVSYLAFEFPTGYLMQRLPTAKYLGANVALWGVIVACTSAASNFGGLITLRVLLGVFESAVAPALILISSMWFKTTEQPLRIGFWYCGTGIGVIFGSLASFGFQHYEGGIFSSWQIMFLVFGLITVAVGILVVLILPDNPMSAKFLSEPERICALERVKGNQTGIENKHFKPAQVLECFKDPQTWLVSIIVISMNIPNGAISSYQATIIKSFGYTSKETALLQIPSGAISVVSIVGATWSASRFNTRGPFVIVLMACGTIGGCLLAFTSSKSGRLVGNYMTNCIGAALPLMYSVASANFAGHTKKVTMNAILLISFCLGNIIGPLTFRQQDEPEYIPAKITIVVTTIFTICMVLCLMGYYRWQNARRDARKEDLVRVSGDTPEASVESVKFDLTDRQNPNFRYCL